MAEEWGTVNKRTAESAYGTLIHRIQGLDLPHFELVRSTIIPMTRSDTPSNSLEINMTIPMVAGLIPT